MCDKRKEDTILRGATAWLTVLGAALIAALTAGFIGAARFHASAVPDAETIAEVNGDPVTAAEFRRFLAQQRAAVIDHFTRTRGTVVDERFWRTEFDGETPADAAKRLALEAAVRFKVELGLAREHGLIPETSREYLLVEMEKENARRSEAARSGLPVYGPVRFDENGFVEYFLGRIVTHLKESMAERELDATDERLRRHYESIKDELFRLEDEVRYEEFSVSYLADGARVDAGLKEAARETLEAVRQRLERGETAEAAIREAEREPERRGTAEPAARDAEQAGGPGVRHAERLLNGDTARTLYRSLPELYEAVTRLTDADPVSPVIDDAASGRLVLARLIERQPQGYRSFEEQKANVRSHYLNIAYDAYVQRLVRNADVMLAEDAYRKIDVNR